MNKLEIEFQKVADWLENNKALGCFEKLGMIVELGNFQTYLEGVIKIDTTFNFKFLSDFIIEKLEKDEMLKFEDYQEYINRRVGNGIQSNN